MPSIEATVTGQKITATVGGGTGPTGSQGPSGVIVVSAPLTNAGTTTSAQLGLSVGSGLQVSGGSLALASHTHAASQITDFNAAVVAAAPPTTNASLLTSGTLSDARLSANIARTSDVASAVSAVIDAAPQALDTLNELAAALNDDANFAGTVTTALAGKVSTSDPRLTDSRNPNSHSHGSVTNDGKIGTTSGLVVTTGADGVLQASATIPPSAVSGLATVATSGSYNDLTNKPSAYSLPTASSTVLGGVKIGSGISIDGDGVISASSGYTLPNATTTTLGGVIVGTGLGVSAGTVSVTYGTTSTTACVGDDARLSDSRNPLAHSQAWSTITSTPTTLSGYGITDAVSSSDPRLTDARTPLSHTHPASAISDSTAAGRAILTGVDAAAQRTSLGLGTLATQSGTFSGTSSGTNTGDQTISLTGDISGSGTGSFATTLANTAVAAGSYGSASSVATFTVDPKGRLTSAGATSIAIASGAVSGLGGAATLNVGTSAGTVAAGDHTHTQLHDRSHAITSSSDHTATAWRVFYSDASGAVTELALGSSGSVLTSAGAAAAPSWGFPVPTTIDGGSATTFDSATVDGGSATTV